MREFRTKIKRQIEILGLAIAYPGKYRTIDLAELYQCEELTIKRDLTDLRNFGIDIHSKRNSGIMLFNKFGREKLEPLILQYMGMCYSELSIDKATNLIIDQLDLEALKYIVLLQRGIDNSKILIIDYQKSEKVVEREKWIEPIVIFQSDGVYRLLAKNDGVKKQFILNKILKIRETDFNFKKPLKNEIQQLFKYSWKSWIGEEQIYIKLKISKVWVERLKSKLLMDESNTVFLEDGSVIYQTIVNSISETASWIASRGYGITVLEPEVLKKQVIQIAEETLKNYKK